MFGGSFGGQEIIVVLVLVLILFGAKRIPDIMRGFGQGLREFKEASQKAMDEIDSATTTATTTAATSGGTASVGKTTTAEAPTPEESPDDSADAE